MSYSDAPIHVSLKVSRSLTIAVIIAHCAMLALLIHGFPFHGATLAIAAAVIVSFVLSLTRISSRRTDAIEALLLGSDDRWKVGTRYFAAAPAELISGAFVTAQLTVLCFRLGDGRRRTAFILPDNVHADVFRRLRVRLRVSR